jgi:hypothetical protein
MDAPVSINLSRVRTSNSALYMDSSLREKLIEHVFVGELLRVLWRRGVRNVEVLRAEVDCGGYDLVLERKGIVRHVQFKSSHLAARTREVAVSLKLAEKPSGCVIWMLFEEDTLELRPFLWFGGAPGQKLPPLGDRVARHSKADRTGRKAERPNLRILKRPQFTILPAIDDVVTVLFGTPEQLLAGKQPFFG